MRCDQLAVLVLSKESQTKPEIPAVPLLDPAFLRRSVRET